MTRASVNNYFMDPMRWGMDHEKFAVCEYCQITDRDVKSTGLWLFPNKYLGASPDGIIWKDREETEVEGIIEVKCSWPAREYDWESAIKNGKRPKWILDDDAKILDRAHNHYHQIQGQLFATEAKWCDLVTWAPKFIKIILVYPDWGWYRRNLPVLKKFYREFLEPLVPKDQLPEISIKGMSSRLTFTLTKSEWPNGKGVGLVLDGWRFDPSCSCGFDPHNGRRVDPSCPCGFESHLRRILILH